MSKKLHEKLCQKSHKISILWRFWWLCWHTICWLSFMTYNTIAFYDLFITYHTMASLTFKWQTMISNIKHAIIVLLCSPLGDHTGDHGAEVHGHHEATHLTQSRHSVAHIPASSCHIWPLAVKNGLFSNSIVMLQWKESRHYFSLSDTNS